MITIKNYIYKSQSYTSLYALAEALGRDNTYIPLSISDNHLTALGVTVSEITEDISVLKQRKLYAVDQWTANKIVGGFTSNASGQTVRYDSDKDTQITMQGIALNVNTPLFAQEYPQGCPVRGYVGKDADKTIVYLSAEQVLQWCADLSMHIGSCKQAGWAKQAEVNACSSVDELDKIEVI